MILTGAFLIMMTNTNATCCSFHIIFTFSFEYGVHSVSVVFRTARYHSKTHRFNFVVLLPYLNSHLCIYSIALHSSSTVMCILYITRWLVFGTMQTTSYLPLSHSLLIATFACFVVCQNVCFNNNNKKCSLMTILFIVTVICCVCLDIKLDLCNMWKNYINGRGHGWRTKDKGVNERKQKLEI